MADACVGIFGRIFGHRFRARFCVSEHEISWPPDDGLYKSCALLANGRDAIIRVERRYVGEICERCGSSSRRPLPDSHGP